MKDRIGNDIGAPGQSTGWADIDWKQVYRKVRNLRRRIFRATQEQKWKKVKSLMKLMLRSYSNLLVAVRRVTQDNITVRPCFCCSNEWSGSIYAPIDRKTPLE